MEKDNTITQFEKDSGNKIIRDFIGLDVRNNNLDYTCNFDNLAMVIDKIGRILDWREHKRAVESFGTVDKILIFKEIVSILQKYSNERRPEGIYEVWDEEGNRSVAQYFHSGSDNVYEDYWVVFSNTNIKTSHFNKIGKEELFSKIERLEKRGK